MKDTKSCDGANEVKAGKVIEIHEERLNRHLDKIVRGTVEETLNALLDTTRLPSFQRIAAALKV